MTGVEEISYALLREGVDDWWPIDVLLWHAREASPDPADSFKEVAVSVLGFLLSQDLATVGEIGESGFEPWSTSFDETMETVVSKCESVNWEPFGGLCWISNTAKGNRYIQ